MWPDVEAVESRLGLSFWLTADMVVLWLWLCCAPFQSSDLLPPQRDVCIGALAGSYWLADRGSVGQWKGALEGAEWGANGNLQQRTLRLVAVPLCLPVCVLVLVLVLVLVSPSLRALLMVSIGRELNCVLDL